jgi:hydrogenase 3 maturation protease
MKEKLQQILNQEKSNILFAGIGNVLRNDDGIGVYITSHIAENDKIKALCVEVSIENYISKINNQNPDVLILVDCMNFNKEPGFYDLIPVEETTEFTINSHHISLRRVSAFFKMKVYVIGIQPANLNVGEIITPVVKASADKVIEMINHFVRN